MKPRLLFLFIAALPLLAQPCEVSNQLKVAQEAYVRRLIPQLSIPPQLDRRCPGVLRQERIGFGSGDDKWIDEMIATLEESR